MNASPSSGRELRTLMRLVKEGAWQVKGWAPILLAIHATDVLVSLLLQFPTGTAAAHIP
jgi:hypothetical protein